MNEREAGPALLAWLDQHVPEADAAELAELVRSLRRQGLRRRGAARRAFRAAFVARVPVGERDAAQEAVAWLFGERWLSPAAADLPSGRPAKRALW